MVVNNLRKEPWIQPPSPLPDGNLERRILGPRYNLAEVQRICDGPSIWIATDQADDDLDDLEWGKDDVALLIRALRGDDYSCSEWCYTRSKLAVDADVYLVPYDHKEERRDPTKMRYYVKFGFVNNRVVIAVISCHWERESR